MRACVLVSGDFVPWGGMDRANYEFAWHLAEREGVVVHLVSHRVAEPLASHRNVVWVRVPRPFGLHALGGPLLALMARRVAGRLAGSGARVVVNGGNCPWPDINWVHAVHAAWGNRDSHSSWLYRLRAAWLKRCYRRAERAALGLARLVITNSRRTRDQVLAAAAIPPGSVHAVYYGTDPAVFKPASAAGRSAARRALGLDLCRPLVVFIGALGHDRNKGFDVLFDAWERLCRDPAWDADLLAAGAGRDVGHWRGRVREEGLDGRIRMLGFSSDVPALLSAADAFVSPTHYDAYGLGVHEALCCGLPAFVTRTAGVAERVPPDLGGLLLPSPPEPEDLAARLRAWRSDMEGWRARVAPLSAELRRRTWTDMSREIVGLMEATQ